MSVIERWTIKVCPICRAKVRDEATHCWGIGRAMHTKVAVADVIVRADDDAGAVSLLCDLVDALDNVVNPGDAGEPYDRALAFVAQQRRGR